MSDAAIPLNRTLMPTATEWQVTLINLSPDAIITCDTSWVISGWNHGAEELYGWTETEAVGTILPLLLRTESFSTARIHSSLQNRNQWEGELEHRHRNNKRILVESRQVMARNADGSDIRVLAIDRDITARRRAEEVLARAMEEKTVLLQEIHHRVKNSLAVTASLLSMKADDSSSEARQALEEGQQRLHSIALVHEHLYACDRLDRIDFNEYARELVAGVYSAFSTEACRIDVALELNPIEIAIDRAVPCALILNELLTNAFKYAFIGRRTGRILVSLCQPEAGVCELAVEDDGVGLAPGVLGGPHKSLGLRIISILANQLDGSIEHGEGPGTRITLRFPTATSGSWGGHDTEAEAEFHRALLGTVAAPNEDHILERF